MIKLIIFKNSETSIIKCGANNSLIFVIEILLVICVDYIYTSHKKYNISLIICESLNKPLQIRENQREYKVYSCKKKYGAKYSPQ